MIIFGRRRNVRVHQVDDGPSTEGVLVGKPWRNGGHYVVRKPSILVAEESSLPLAASEVWIPRERVIFLEILG